MQKTGGALIALGVVLSGCASSSGNVTGSYISPLQYQQYSCEQIGAEATRVSARVSELSGVEDSNATGDAVKTGVAIVLFWPAAFFMTGNGQTAAELGRLKGEFESLEQAAIQKNCNIRFQQKTAAPAH